jgi:hypothetical protein
MEETATSLFRVLLFEILLTRYQTADPGYRAVSSMGLRSLAGWNSGFESRRVYGCLSVISVVCCHVEFSASG